MPARGGGGGSGGGVFVLVHRNVAMESLVGICASPYKEERGAEEDEKGSESSSIGADEESSLSLSSSSEGAEQDEAQSRLREEDDDDDDDEEEDLGEVVDESALGSLEDLEDALPIKRGLSNYFSGKAKSFSSLADIVTAPTTVADLAKQEHPFNKRRRVLMAAKKRAAWPRRASCSSLNTLPMPSLLESELRVLEEEDEEEDRDSRGESPRHLPPLPPLSGRGLKSFRAPRSFSLVDLQQHDQQHDEFC